MTLSIWIGTLIILTLSIETFAWRGDLLGGRKILDKPREDGGHYRLRLPPRADETATEDAYPLPWSYGYNPPPPPPTPSPSSTLSAFLNSTTSSSDPSTLFSGGPASNAISVKLKFKLHREPRTEPNILLQSLGVWLCVVNIAAIVPEFICSRDDGSGEGEGTIAPVTITIPVTGGSGNGSSWLTTTLTKPTTLTLPVIIGNGTTSWTVTTIIGGGGIGTGADPSTIASTDAVTGSAPSISATLVTPGTASKSGSASSESHPSLKLARLFFSSNVTVLTQHNFSKSQRDKCFPHDILIYKVNNGLEAVNLCCLEESRRSDSLSWIEYRFYECHICRYLLFRVDAEQNGVGARISSGQLDFGPVFFQRVECLRWFTNAVGHVAVSDSLNCSKCDLSSLNCKRLVCLQHESDHFSGGDFLNENQCHFYHIHSKCVRCLKRDSIVIVVSDRQQHRLYHIRKCHKLHSDLQQRACDRDFDGHEQCHHYVAKYSELGCRLLGHYSDCLHGFVVRPRDGHWEPILV
ncbi:hypothetical protein Micbo1qcDRAFT_176336 [Microdochium bolleyi]|uniref:C2H2-type domain-containing protein n=1 Tax=Microdochium bolleyi TaxID=196109 RepID=A0A136J0A1_9PEZI|nr:hypothetical protein Micbo1qcDRAFT_176336 [Microdochium bolleyi]